jgi:pantetheine-phosphate adenylyltransferase
MPPRTAVFPGTFDPVTNGHLDVIRRAAGLFDRLVVAVAGSRGTTLLDLDERVALVKENVAGLAHVEVATFDGLLVDLARRLGATAIVRGVRTYQDWEYELRMVQMNRHLAPSIETVFLAPSAEHAFISGSLIREVAALGADLSGLVPGNVALTLARRRRAGPSAE